MTGFGKAQGIVAGKKISVEIKSVNSKGLDLNTKMPSIYREKEMLIRKELGTAFVRGKIECSIYYDVIDDANSAQLNTSLMENYLSDLKAFEKEQGLPATDYMQVLLRMPEVFKTERAELDEEEWKGLSALINEACDRFQEFRAAEGASIELDFTNNVNEIERLLSEVPKYEQERIDTVKTRIKSSIDELIDQADVDQNRFEQELIYYIEKLDINEEKVRLANHCKYFKETMAKKDSNGKKLGFISQEMGREINTLGSKANHAELQKLVVDMKDNLEKIKEQILNVL